MADDPVKKTVSDMPEPNPDAIAAEQMREAAKASGEGLSDAVGAGFDPALHETMPDGSPRLSTKGKLLRKRGMGARGAQSPRARAAGGAGAMGPDAQRQAAAMGATQCVVMCGMMLGGDEWTPSDDETLMLNTAFDGYMKANEMTDLPPGVTLVLALSMYSIPRLSRPKTKSTLARVKGWVIDKYLRVRYRNARPDSRPNNERENVNREASGG